MRELSTTKKRVFSDEWRKHLSEAHMGQASWCKGKKLVDERVSQEKRKIYIKEWRRENHDKLLELQRSYYKKDINKSRAQAREYYRNNRQKELDRIRQKKYGITGDEFRKTIERQDFRCPICNQDIAKNPSVDHNHVTGKIRGLICNKCNLAIGNAEESPGRLRRMADYLERNE